MDIFSKFVKESWYLYKYNLVGICAILLPITLPIDGINTALEYFPDLFDISGKFTFILWLSQALIYPIYQGAIIFYIGSLLTGKTQRVTGYYQQSLKIYGSLLSLYFISTIAISVGMLLLIIPGLILAARIMFAEFYCAFEGGNDAFNYSITNTKEYQWLLLAGMLFFVFVCWTPLIGIEYLLNQYELMNWPISFALSVIATLLGPLITIFAFRVYTHHQEMLNKGLQPTSGN